MSTENVSTDPIRHDVPPRPPPAPVTSLRLLDVDQEFMVPRRSGFINVGRQPKVDDTACGIDIALPSTSVSRMHASLRWRGPRLWLTDTSMNGTSVDGVDVADKATVQIVAGHVVRFADVQVLALNEPLRALRKELGWSVGFDHKVLDALLLAVIKAGDDAIALVGSTGCGQEALAKAIHDASSRCEQAYKWFDDAQVVQTDDIEAARYGTVALDYGERLIKLDRPVPKLLSSSQCTVRSILCVYSERQLRDVQSKTRVQLVKLRPLSDRLDELPRLLDRLFMHSPVAHKKLTPSVRARLCQNPWWRNLQHLHNSAEDLIAVCEDPTLRAAASRRKKSHTTLLENAVRWLGEELNDD